MARIAGISFIKDSRGRSKKIVIDLDKWGKELEEFLDNLDVDLRKDEKTVPWEKAKSTLNKKYGIKA